MPPKIRIAQGHTIGGMYTLIPQPDISEYLSYDFVYDSTGIARARGGGTAVLSYTAATVDEARTILRQFNLTTYKPSAYITVELPDALAVYQPFRGVATLDIGSFDGEWWREFNIRLTGLVPHAI